MFLTQVHYCVGSTGMCAIVTPRTATSPWWQLLFQRPQQYRKALEEQVQWLEQQLRQITEERKSLRQRLDASPTLPLLDRRKYAQIVQLQQELAVAQEQFEELSQAKQALVDLLQEQEQKIQNLVEQCEQAHKQGHDINVSYQLQLDELTTQLHQQTQEQFTKLDHVFQEQIRQAQQQAKEQAWKEGKERLAKVTAQLQKQFEAELQAEKLRTSQAIERQGQKMRSLAKALALREKKLYQQQQQDQLNDQERQRATATKLQEQKIWEVQLREQKLSQQQKEAEEMEQFLLRQQQQQDRRIQEEQDRVQLVQKQEQQRQQQQVKLIEQEEQSRLQQVEKKKGEHTSRLLEPFEKVLSPFRKVKTTVQVKSRRTISSPVSTAAKAANWQRRVPWQPGLPPMDLLGDRYVDRCL